MRTAIERYTRGTCIAGISMLPSIDRFSSTCTQDLVHSQVILTTRCLFENLISPIFPYVLENHPYLLKNHPYLLENDYRHQGLIIHLCKIDYDNIATISYDADSATTSKSIVQINEEKSHLKQKKSKPENKILVQELEE
ncbi:PREDICTED: uncharacterized protein LOC108694367 [Atta colombica]|uniref:uncharacterized protein LOC108694367 n=1 Tax=Atta colombica TaxID=520822 RepID=UPI00084C7C1D|nr:PREDICTED: uncharacterized protein LOC108694367 [Atta colombica]